MAGVADLSMTRRLAIYGIAFALDRATYSSPILACQPDRPEPRLTTVSSDPLATARSRLDTALGLSGLACVAECLGGARIRLFRISSIHVNACIGVEGCVGAWPFAVADIAFETA